MTEAELHEFFHETQMDEGAKAVFLAMTRTDQLLAILGMLAWNRSETANIKKDVIEIKTDFAAFKHETRDYRKKREEKEDQTLTTSEKINLTLEKRFKFWVPIVQYVLSTVTVIVILWLLRGAFGANVIP